MEIVNGFLQAVAANETHHIERSAVRMRAQAVDRHDAGVLEPAGDFRFQKKACPALRIVRVFVVNLFEGDLAVQFLVLGNKNRSQTTLGMRPHHAKTPPCGGERADRGLCAPLWRAGRCRRQRGQSSLQVCIGDLLQFFFI